ncbi:hypothetical protein C7H79_16715 [Nitrosomonas supralitoralis]|uniref:Uncharacterized protein n=2 Tax=Nitrosomonas supralitoralis TaxID=2116706 RepID=A0A2P7NQX8_9PROT|nr:hypothetical protein C7H79_16715 [Nitrosomonas supralitoralis]
MNEITDLLISEGEAIRLFMFAFASILGMLFAYVNRWANSDSKETLKSYLFGDPKAVVKAFSTLFMLWAGAGGLSYLDTLTGFNIFLAGAGIGYLVPQTVEKREVVNVSAPNTKSK